MTLSLLWFKLNADMGISFERGITLVTLLLSITILIIIGVLFYRNFNQAREKKFSNIPEQKNISSKQYNNYLYNFSFEFDPAIKIWESYRQGFGLTLEKPNQEFSLIIGVAEDECRTEQGVDLNSKLIKDSKKGKVSIGDETAYYYEFNLGISALRLICIRKGNHWFGFLNDIESDATNQVKITNKEYFDQIINSFKFSVIGSQPHLKTYSDSGITFSYYDKTNMEEETLVKQVGSKVYILSEGENLDKAGYVDVISRDDSVPLFKQMEDYIIEVLKKSDCLFAIDIRRGLPEGLFGRRGIDEIICPEENAIIRAYGTFLYNNDKDKFIYVDQSIPNFHFGANWIPWYETLEITK